MPLLPAPLYTRSKVFLATVRRDGPLHPHASISAPDTDIPAPQDITTPSPADANATAPDASTTAPDANATASDASTAAHVLDVKTTAPDANSTDPDPDTTDPDTTAETKLHVAAKAVPPQFCIFTRD